MTNLIILFQNIAYLLALCFVQRFITERWPRNETAGKLASGLLYGLVCVVTMNTAITFAPGVIFDARTVVLSMAGLFGGPFVAVIAGTIAGAHRLYLGGGGTLVGVVTILTSVLTGLAFHHLYREHLTKIRPRTLLAIGVTVHVITILWFYFLPIDFVQDVLLTLAPPYLILLSFTTVLMGTMLREIEKFHRVDVLLDESQDRFRLLFNTSTVSIWEEDFSQVLNSLDGLRKQGVTDLRTYLAQHPQYLSELATSIKVNRTNPAALKLFKAGNEQQLIRNIETTFRPGTSTTFVEALCAIWEGKQNFVAETSYRTLDGSVIDCIISIPIPSPGTSSRHVPVSIIDISNQKQIEKELARERQRLQEILRGTDVGTWEWNVQTGQTVFNERWAEMIGYTLEEISPVSIETWGRYSHPDDLKQSEANLQQVFSKESGFYQCEVRMRHKSGKWVWVLDRGKVVEWMADGKPLRMSGTHSDITERKETEILAQRLSRLRETMLQCHSIMLTEKDEHQLMQKMVDVLVSNHQYILVWIGMPEHDEERSIKPVVAAGPVRAYLDNIVVHWSGDRYSQGPTGMAMMTGKTQILQVMADSEKFQPWIEAAQKAGFKGSIALPLFDRGKVIAVITVYSPIDNSFDVNAVSILTEFSNNLGFAIQALRTEVEKDRIRTELNQSALGAINAIAATIEKRDPYTSGHQQRVAGLSVAIARQAGWDESRIEGLRLGAIIHDIGKIYVPAEILNRPGRLSLSEFEIIKSHPQVGYEILEHTHFPWPIKEMVSQHHERLDGSGYPHGLKAEQIIDEARIIAIADVVEAITSHRPYRAGRGIGAALDEIRRGKGSAYDARYVDICIRLFEQDNYRWDDALPVS